jgi:hypothetical protein
MRHMSDEDRKISKLAVGNELRLNVLEARRERRKERSRRVECTVCLETTYSFRDKADICENCLADLWSAQDVSRATTATGQGEGMVAVKFSRRSHDFPFPHMRTGHRRIPEGAIFSIEKDSSPERTFMALMNKLLTGLAEAFPLHPESKRSAMPLLGTNYDADLHALLPKKTVAAIMELYSFTPWLSYESFDEGLTQGRNLLGQINLGQITVDDFNEQIRKQTADLKRAREKAEAGEKQ